jgi:Tol biopolymer transport system component
LGDDDIYLMDKTGRNLRLLVESAGLQMHPEWSPDGKRIAYQAMVDTDFELFLLDVWEDNAPIRLTDNDGSDRHPTFTPDGTRILYATDAYNIIQTFELYTINIDGTGARRFHTFGQNANALHPSYSPDGNFVVFDGFIDGAESGVFVVNSNGRGLARRIAGFQANENAYLPSWSDDSSGVFFVSSTEGHNQIYRVPLAEGEVNGRAERVTYNMVMSIQPTIRR